MAPYSIIVYIPPIKYIIITNPLIKITKKLTNLTFAIFFILNKNTIKKNTANIK